MKKVLILILALGMILTACSTTTRRSATYVGATPQEFQEERKQDAIKIYEADLSLLILQTKLNKLLELLEDDRLEFINSFFVDYITAAVLSFRQAHQAAASGYRSNQYNTNITLKTITYLESEVLPYIKNQRYNSAKDSLDKLLFKSAEYWLMVTTNLIILEDSDVRISDEYIKLRTTPR